MMIIRRLESLADRHPSSRWSGGELERWQPRRRPHGEAPSLEDLALLARVDEAIAATNLPVGTSCEPGSCSETNWLRLLSFAYASGVLDSEEICQLCLEENWFWRLGLDQEPLAERLCRFRRENRERLEMVLARVLPSGEPANNRLADFAAERRARARDLLNLARHLDTCE